MGKKIVFMGTPNFAVSILQELLDTEYEPILVISQPDKPKGRKKRIQPTPVKMLAEQAGIEVVQPENARKKSFVDWFVEQDFDLNIVVAYGQILSERLINAPRLGSINLHTSLLPKWRGCAPVHWAILAGDEKTGVSIQKMVRDLDAGPLFAREGIKIHEHEDADILLNRLAVLGSNMLLDVLPKIFSETLQPTPQEDWDKTYARILVKKDGTINWKKSATEIRNRVRALHLWPSLTLVRPNGEIVKIHNVEIVSNKKVHETQIFYRNKSNIDCKLRGQPGEVIFVSKEELWIACLDENISIKEIQPTGKKSMKIADYLRGRKVNVGEIWEPKP